MVFIWITHNLQLFLGSGQRLPSTPSVFANHIGHIILMIGAQLLLWYQKLCYEFDKLNDTQHNDQHKYAYSNRQGHTQPTERA
jgi:hypothetical protein